MAEEQTALADFFSSRRAECSGKEIMMNNNISRFTVGGLSALLLTCVIAGTAYAGNAVKKNKLIDEQTAEDFAILDAGVQEEEVTGMTSELENDKGKYVYDIKFYVENTEYEYTIRAEDGVVLEKEVEQKTAAGTADRKETADRDDQQNTATEAGKSANGEKDVNTAEITAQKNDQKVSQKDDQKAEEVKNSAGTQNTESAQKSGTATYISVDQAKQTALDHAGFTADQVRFSSAKLDNDNNEKPEYEIEFYVGKMEYDYDIDAVTGEILDFSKEYDDD
jgi:uncharacterized membrane protein YkoI